MGPSRDRQVEAQAAPFIIIIIIIIIIFVFIIRGCHMLMQPITETCLQGKVINVR